MVVTVGEVRSPLRDITVETMEKKVELGEEIEKVEEQRLLCRPQERRFRKRVGGKAPIWMLR